MSHAAMQFVPVNSMAKREVVVVSQALCADDMHRLESGLATLTLDDALVGAAGVSDPSTRVSRIAWLENGEPSAWLFTALMRHVQAANLFFGLRIWGFAECLQYSEYGVGGHYRWHRDNGIDPEEGPRPPRKVSFSLQLSYPDEYDGGDLEIHAADDRAQTRERGALILFPSYVTHRVTMVTRGVRRSLVGWACGEDFS